MRFQIFLCCLKAKFQIPLSAEACLRLSPRHPFINPFYSVNGDHRLSNYLTFTFLSFVTEEDCVRMSLRLCLYLCICIFAPCICANMSNYGFHKITSRWCNQNQLSIIISNKIFYAAHLAAN